METKQSQPMLFGALLYCNWLYIALFVALLCSDWSVSLYIVFCCTLLAACVLHSAVHNVPLYVMFRCTLYSAVLYILLYFAFCCTLRLLYVMIFCTLCSVVICHYISFHAMICCTLHSAVRYDVLYITIRCVL